MARTMASSSAGAASLTPSVLQEFYGLLMAYFAVCGFVRIGTGRSACRLKTIRIGCPWPYSVRGVYRRRPNPAAIAFHSTNRKFRRLSFIATNNPNREISIPSVVSAPTRKTPTSRSVSRENT